MPSWCHALCSSRPKIPWVACNSETWGSGEGLGTFARRSRVWSVRLRHLEFHSQLWDTAQLTGTGVASPLSCSSWHSSDVGLHIPKQLEVRLGAAGRSWALGNFWGCYQEQKHTCHLVPWPKSSKIKPKTKWLSFSFVRSLNSSSIYMRSVRGSFSLNHNFTSPGA